MPHLINTNRDILSIRLMGRVEAHDLQYELHSALEKLTRPVTIILDLVLADGFNQQVKALCFRLLQHRMVEQIGICATAPDVQASAREMAQALSRVRPVKLATTEHDLLHAFGLADEPTNARKPAGMLRFLTNAAKGQEAQK